MLVCGFSLSVVIALLLLILKPNPEYPLSMADVAKGMTFSLGDPLERSAVLFAVISLLGALGTTANEMFMYPYWILEKGYAQNLGSADDEGWVDRAKGWIKVLQVDAGVATLLATVITAAYFLVGCAILHKRGEGPHRNEGRRTTLADLHRDLRRVVVQRLHVRWLLYPVLDHRRCRGGLGTMWTDLLSSMGTFQYDNDTARRRYNRIFQNLYRAAFLGITLYSTLFGAAPEKLVIMGQFINGLVNTPLLMIGILYLAFKTDKRLRMSTFTSVALIVTAIAILSCIVMGFFGGGGHYFSTSPAGNGC
ncbi:MAG: hypothetical protein Ct9H300mP1_04800 [Planctomycetaceae bacterium]|nr:MAG: hypothetical protein Ct9H300mP1_04800 [Planctomycetaceae bacterium]